MQNKILKNVISFIFLVSLMAISTGCKVNPVQLTDLDNGKDVSLAVGGQLIITLPGNPTTGFNWELSPLEGNILSLVGEPQFVSDNSDALGSGGKMTFTFDAKKAGSTALVLIYHRPWETDVEPLQTFTINVSVK
jgi:inhibitor of cysteine peptidase